MLDEFAKYAFFGLKRKRRNFERSVLKYVSIKIPALTHSGRKSRVCVNQPDRLSPAANPLLLFFCLPPWPSSEAGREVAFLKLAAANAEAMAGVGRICKIRVFRPEKEAPGF